jgi:hypothetical protein
MDTVLAGRKAATGSLLVNLEIARLAAIQHLLPASGQAHIGPERFKGSVSDR